MRCEAMTREQYGYRLQCSRNAAVEIQGHRFCIQHADRAMRHRMIYLVDGGFLRVAKMGAV